MCMKPKWISVSLPFIQYFIKFEQIFKMYENLNSVAL